MSKPHNTRHTWPAGGGERTEETCTAGCGVVRIPRGRTAWQYRPWPLAEVRYAPPPCHPAATVEAWLHAQDPDRLWTTADVASAVGLSFEVVSTVLLMLTDAQWIDRFAPTGQRPAAYCMGLVKQRAFEERYKSNVRWQPPENRR